MKILSVDDVSLSFGGLEVLSNISFDVNEGEIFAIIGPNGAGKTSTLNIISGFYGPEKGKILFKDKDITPPVLDGITNYSPSGFLSNFLNPNNFQMNHSVGMSYSTIGGSGVALSTYTNSMALRLTENLNIEVDASLVASPYSSFGKEHQKSINGIYLTRAQLNYKISDNSHLMIQYLNLPPGTYYNNYYNSSPFSRGRFMEGF